MRKILCYPLALLLQVYSGAHATDLWQFYQAAQRYDAKFAQSHQTYKEAQTLNARARSAFLPKVTIDANTTYNRLSSRFLNIPPGLDFPNGTYAFNSNGYGINFIQPLFNLRALYAFRAAHSRVNAAKIRYRLAHTELALAVTSAYFTILSAKNDLALTYAEQRALKAELRRAKRSFHLGRATITDANEARARYDMVKAQVLNATNTLRIARSRMTRITGLRARHLWLLNLAKLPKPPARATLNTDLHTALETNPSIQVAQATEHSQNAQTRAARARWLPTISIAGGYNYSRADNSTFGFGSVVHDAAIGLDLSWPIYQGGEFSAATAHADAAARKAFLGVLRTRRRVRFEVRQAFLNVRNGYAEVEALRTAEHANRVALQSDELGLRVGIRNYVDVLEAQQAFYAARHALVQAVYSYLLSRLYLQAGLTEVTASDIRTLNGLLLPPATAPNALNAVKPPTP